MAFGTGQKLSPRGMSFSPRRHLLRPLRFPLHLNPLNRHDSSLPLGSPASTPIALQLAGPGRMARP